jgi:ATP-dependent helicase Lhr and Lhr-like helicase
MTFAMRIGITAPRKRLKNCAARCSVVTGFRFRVIWIDNGLSSMSHHLSHLRELKEKLPHTWSAILGRFGRFTEIQSLAVEPLLAGENCILVSSTASGKTEAALMPLIERLKRNSNLKPHNSLQMVYVVPTRALTRDLAKRLGQPLEQLAIPMQIKTGDEPTLKSHHSPQLLLTTPESLDSLLANRPRMLKDVRAVVLDEIHLLDNSARGDQLRILLNRLRRLRRYAFSRGDSLNDEVQFCALSATVNDPLSVAARYFSEPVVIQTEGQRRFDAELIEMQGCQSLIELFADFPRRGIKKVMAFCNSRAECEELARAFGQGSPFGDRVFVHHASLDVRVRHATERNFTTSEAALCFATSTLELGIDIGDVDLVMLISPPENTSAFLQRLGRSNRRASRAAVVCFYRGEIERAMFQVFIRAAASGELEASHYFFRPAIVVQQLCSYIKQTRNGEIVVDAAYELFTSPTGVPLIVKTVFAEIIEHLIDKDYFVALPNGVLKPGARWQTLYEHREIYSNLMDTRRNSMDVVDEMTGRKLGIIEWGASRGTTFLFGGQARRAKRKQGRKLIVQAAEGEAANAPGFRSAWRPLSRELAKAIGVQLGLPQAVSASEIAVGWESRVDRDGDESASLSSLSSFSGAWVFHCAGDAYGIALGDLLERFYGVKVSEHNSFCFRVEGELPDEPLQLDAAQVRAQVLRRWRQFEKWFDVGRFHEELPLKVRRENAVEAFDIDGFFCAFSGIKFV